MTALYSVYRSQRFEDLVGQEAAARTLKNALVSGRVAHAYLFTGIRGTGKTSTARILAKAVNCLNPKDGEPCNECTSCVAITEGSATDLIEIDAASNRGVDEIRDLREKAKYLPAQLKRKVYIIDEAHQLTPEAFNALLKTLEEPPEHVLFILCTTEAHKLPATIISRCQRFDFRRIDEADIAGRLQQIVTGEGLVAADDGLALIATMAHGSMRDAITMLDQMASAGAASIDAEAVRQHLGLVSAPELAALLAGAARGDAAFVLREIERQAQRGADLRQLANGLAEMARKAVLISLGAANAAELGLDPASGADLTAAVGAAGREFAAAAFEAALAASTEMKQTHDPRLLLELLLLRLASGRDEAPPGATEPAGAGASAGAPAAAGSGASDRAGSARASQAKADGDTATDRGKPASAGEDEADRVEGQADAVAAAVAGEAGADGPSSEASVVDPPAGDMEVADGGPAGVVDTPAGPPIAPEVLEDIVRAWPRLFDAFKGTGPGVRVRALLKEAGPLDLAGDMLTIGFPYAIFSEKAQEPLNRQELERALSEVYGQAFRLTFQTVSAERLRGTPPAAHPVAGSAPPGAGASPPVAGPDGAPASSDLPPAGAPGEGSGEGVVQAAQKILGARITDVRSRRPGEAGT